MTREQLKKEAMWRCQDTVLNQLLEVTKVPRVLGLTLVNRTPWYSFKFLRALRSPSRFPFRVGWAATSSFVPPDPFTLRALSFRAACSVREFVTIAFTARSSAEILLLLLI